MLIPHSLFLQTDDLETRALVQQEARFCVAIRMAKWQRLGY